MTVGTKVEGDDSRFGLVENAQEFQETRPTQNRSPEQERKGRRDWKSMMVSDNGILEGGKGIKSAQHWREWQPGPGNE